MSTSFEFDDSTLGTGGYLAQGQLTRSSSAGASSAVLRGRTISSSTDVDVLAITLVAGRSYLFDIDQGWCQTNANSSQFRRGRLASVGAERPPLGESGGTAGLVGGALGEASFRVEVVVDGSVH